MYNWQLQQKKCFPKKKLPNGGTKTIMVVLRRLFITGELTHIRFVKVRRHHKMKDKSIQTEEYYVQKERKLKDQPYWEGKVLSDKWTKVDCIRSAEVLAKKLAFYIGVDQAMQAVVALG